MVAAVQINCTNFVSALTALMDSNNTPSNTLDEKQYDIQKNQSFQQINLMVDVGHRLVDLT